MNSEVSRDEGDLGKWVFEGFIKCVHPRRPKLAPLFPTLLAFWVTYIRSPLLTERHNDYHSAHGWTHGCWTETGGGHQMWWCIKHITLTWYHRLPDSCVLYTKRQISSVWLQLRTTRLPVLVNCFQNTTQRQRTQHQRGYIHRAPEVTGDACWSTLVQLCKFKTLKALRVKSLKNPETKNKKNDYLML